MQHLVWIRVSENDDHFSRLVVSQDGHNPGHHCMMLFFLTIKRAERWWGACDINL